MTLVVASVKINKSKCNAAMTKELFATEKVYELVKKGMPFREAYRKVKATFK
jgi:argininosuccinate lyase